MEIIFLLVVIYIFSKSSSRSGNIHHTNSTNYMYQDYNHSSSDFNCDDSCFDSCSSDCDCSCND